MSALIDRTRTQTQTDLVNANEPADEVHVEEADLKAVLLGGAQLGKELLCKPLWVVDGVQRCKVELRLSALGLRLPERALDLCMTS